MKPTNANKLTLHPPGTCYFAPWAILLLFAYAAASFSLRAADGMASESDSRPVTSYKNIKVNGLDIFYREAGPTNAPTIILLHGFPTSSHMFRNLIPALADSYHIIAPDYPGYGHSSMPSVNDFDYTFDNLANVVDTFIQELGIQRYSLYVMDYGAPVGFRIATRHPERVQSLIVQNGNAYNEGLLDFWKPFRAYWKERSDANAAVMKNSLLTLDATHWQYTNGVQEQETIDPDNWLVDQALMDRPGNKDIQLALFYSYGSNPPLYPQWQAYFRKYQPPMLIVWGKNDYIFPAEGAYPYLRDLKNVDFHILNTGHFALEEDGPTIAALMRKFLAKQKI
jgi:pimeloyl-ACP methyl ester carboxylesterase